MPRRFMIGVALAGAAALAGWLAFVGDGDRTTIDRHGSTPVEAQPAGRLPIEELPATYRIVYRVEAQGDGELLTTTDELLVRRPFDSALRSHAGDSTEGDLRAWTIASFGRLLLGGADREDLVLAAEPGVTPSDIRLEPVLDDALSRDRIEVRERREVLGRTCQVYRSADPLGGGSVQAPTDDRHTDTCVDAAGLVLEEVLVVEGEVLVRRLAVVVDESPAISDDDFAVDAEPLHVDDGGGSVLRMRHGSRPPADFWRLPEPPPGYEACGRFSVVPPQPENTSDPLRRGLIRSATIDVWVRGPDVLLVEQGGTVGGAHPFELGAEEVDLGPVGDGDIVLNAQGTLVRSLLPGGRYVQVQGTLPAEQLVQLARSLEQVEGGTIEVVQGPPRLAC